jgi:hypothetical protein
VCSLDVGLQGLPQLVEGLHDLACPSMVWVMLHRESAVGLVEFAKFNFSGR